MTNRISIDDKEVIVNGRLIKTAKLRDEHYEVVHNPDNFIQLLNQSAVQADLFTFLQADDDTVPHFDYQLEKEPISVLPVTKYSDWFNRISRSARNKIRKAKKAGIEVRPVVFDDALIEGIMDIYNECPVRQGMKFWHYGKDFETVKRENSTYNERSDFIGAFYEDEMLGFSKIVHGGNVSSLLQIISKISHRDKAPTDALIAKAVEICAEKGIPNLHYGMWSRRSLGEFKVQRGFRRVDVPRYFVPLNWKGRLALASRLHRKFRDQLPGSWIDAITYVRGRWYSSKYHLPRVAH